MSTIIVRSNGEVLEFDAAPEIAFAEGNFVTAHPIEDGSEISDHTQKIPTVITITGVVTNIALSNATNLSPSRQIDAVEFFDAIRKETVAIVGGRFGFRSNMLLTGFPYSWTAGPLIFAAQFREVIFAEAGIVNIPLLAPALAQQVGFPDASDSGEQPTTDANDEEADGVSSILFDALYG